MKLKISTIYINHHSHFKSKNRGGRFNLTVIMVALQLTFLVISCKKWVQVSPPNSSVTGENIYMNDATAASVLTGIYTTLSDNKFQFVTGINSISIKCGLSADELTLFGGSQADQSLQMYYKNDLSNSVPGLFWDPFYQLLLPINSAIEGLNNSSKLTPSVKQQLMGESQFLRAFVNFYLVNLYGNVPLVLTSNYQANANIPTTSKSRVWQQIISDLDSAQRLLSDNYLDATLLNTTTERVRPTKWAAESLLSRAYLYTQNWDSVEVEATTVINNSDLFALDSLDFVFFKNSSEAIWQLQPVYDGQNTMDAQAFILSGGPNTSNNPVYLSSFLLNSFETGDLRFTNWIAVDSSTGIKYFFPYKYKNATYNPGDPLLEYLMVLRLAEQYLNRAEARAEKGDILGAQADLNMIRNRAGLPKNTDSTMPELLTAILHERQVEYFTEWGNRWLDLKRTGSVDSVMNLVTPQKGGSWNSNWQLYPVPLYDLERDLSIDQNPGY